MTVTALGSAGNIDTNCQGTGTFSTTDPGSGVVLPADYTFTMVVGGDNGVHPFSGGATLGTAESWPRPGSSTGWPARQLRSSDSQGSVGFLWLYSFRTG